MANFFSLSLRKQMDSFQLENIAPKYDTCFFERYAKISLETLLGEHYANLVNRDRPDLQDNERGIGIEVTRAIREDVNVAHALINEMAGDEIMEVNDVDRDNIARTGYAYGLGDGNMMGLKEYEYWSLAMPMKRILENKIRKVNNRFYGDYNEFGLFVFTKEDLDKEGIRRVMDFAMQTQEGLDVTYDKLYVSQIQMLYVCDLNIDSFDSFKVSKKQRQLFYDKAIEL